MKYSQKLLFLIPIALALRHANTISMDPNTIRLQQETQNLFKDAFKDFGIPENQIKVSVKIDEGSSCHGMAHQGQDQITFNRGKNASQALVEFAAYHEVAHCMDPKLTQFQLMQLPITLGGVAVSTAAFTSVGFKILNSLVARHAFLQNEKYILAAIGGTFLTSGLLSIVLSVYAIRPFKYQFEHHASRLACQHLLKKNRFDGIAEYLIHLKAYELRGDSRTDWSHPTAKQEFEQIALYLHEHGYHVACSQSRQKRKVRVTILKDGNVISGFSAKVTAK